MKKIDLTGSHYDIGFNVGRLFQKQIHELIKNHTDLNESLLPAYHRPGGEQIFRKYYDFHRYRFPDYWDELCGLAEGAQCEFEKLFLLNLRGEFASIIVENDLAGCTTCTLNTSNGFVLGHNEDSMALFHDCLFLANVKPKGKSGFMTLSYPGFLFGNAMGINRNGLFFTVNITAVKTPGFGIGRYFASRSLLDAGSLPEAIAILAETPRASGFNYTFADLNRSKIMNVEVVSNQLHIRNIEDRYAHTNHYIELSGIDHVVTPSSHHRLIQVQNLIHTLEKPEAMDVLNILGDRSDPPYTIYRKASKPEQTATLITIRLLMNERKLELYYGHPIEYPESKLEFSL